MENQELVVVEKSQFLTPVMNLQLAKARLKEFQEFVREYLVQDEDYGVIPGTPKPTLYKSGADKLCELYHLADSYRILNRTVDFFSGLFDYEIECTLMRDGELISTGIGCCSSYEGKYRWRDSKPRCPMCGKETILKSKKDDGWFCWAKKGGCGASFKPGDKSIEGQQVGGQIENPDLPSVKNTVYKMAKKRAKVDAAIAATRSSGIFSQDLEDLTPDERHREEVQAQVREGTYHPTATELSPMTEAEMDQGDLLPYDRPQDEPKAQPKSDDKITSAQAGRLFAIAKKSGFNNDQIKEICGAAGYAHSKDIRKRHYEKIVESFEIGNPEQTATIAGFLGKWTKEN